MVPAEEGDRPAVVWVHGGDGLERFLGGTPATNSEAHTLASPLTHVRRDVSPTLIIHGSGDQVVPVAQARALEAALRGAGVRHRYVQLPYAQSLVRLGVGQPQHPECPRRACRVLRLEQTAP